MIKRIVPAVLALCVCLLSFSLSVFAYDDVPAVTVQVGGFGTPGIIEGLVPGNAITVEPGETESFTFRKLYIVQPKHNTYISFCIKFEPVNSYAIPLYGQGVSYAVDGLANQENWVVVHRQFYQTVERVRYNPYPSTENAIIDEKCYYFCLKYTGPDVSSGVKEINLKTTMQILNPSGNSNQGGNYQCRINFFNVFISSDITEQINHILSSLDMFQSDSNDFFEELTRRNLYTYTQINYDQEGNGSIQEVATTWHNAVLNSLKSIVAPLAEQVQREQQAKDVGAEDALDTAYDSVGSSFGSLGDLSGLGYLGSFDGDTLGQSGTSGLLSWFSQATANSIDAVPRTKQPLDIVDFYTNKIQSYEQEVKQDGSAPADGD